MQHNTVFHSTNKESEKCDLFFKRKKINVGLIPDDPDVGISKQGL